MWSAQHAHSIHETLQTNPLSLISQHTSPTCCESVPESKSSVDLSLETRGPNGWRAFQRHIRALARRTRQRNEQKQSYISYIRIGSTLLNMDHVLDKLLFDQAQLNTVYSDYSGRHLNEVSGNT